MPKIDAEKSVDEFVALAEFIDHFNVHYQLLLRRYRRFKEIFDGGEGKEAWAMASIIEKGLRNPYHKHNLDYIMQTVMECIGEGVKLN